MWRLRHSPRTCTGISSTSIRISGDDLSDPVLNAKLSVDYPQKPAVLRDISINVCKGEIVGLVGESGSGKRTLALSILRLLDYAGARVRGFVVLNGTDLMRLSEREMRNVRGQHVA